MRNDLTDLTLIVDRSGSMQSICEDAEGGVNSLLEDQKKQEGECVVTIVQFDQQYEFLHKGVPIQDVEKYKLVPRGMTALLDAIGRSINEAGDRLSKMDEKNRPGLVSFVIVTDGLENASNEFKVNQIKKMIKTQQDTYNWQFTFLGADQDAIEVAAGYGISKDDSASFAKGKVATAYSMASNKVSRSRSSGISGQCVSSSFTEEERDAMK